MSAEPEPEPKATRSRSGHKQADIVDGPQREPSSIPRSLQDQAKRLIPGRKRRRSGGGYRSLGDGPIQAKDIPGKIYIGFNGGAAVLDPLAAIARRPLAPLAGRLFDKYLLRDAFWRAIDGYGLPVEKAGKLFLRVGKTRAHEAYRELEAYDSAFAPAPLLRFRLEVLDAIRDGRIARGRETESSHAADAMFIALAGDGDLLRELRDGIGTSSSVSIGQMHRGRDELDREIVDYFIYSNLLWRGR